MDNYRMLQAMFEEATLGVLVVDVGGGIVMTNPFLEKMFGYHKQELTAKSVELLLPESFRARHVGHRKTYHKKPMPRPMGTNLQLNGVRKNGNQFPVEVSLSHMDIDGERFAIAYVSDDTIRKNTLKELKDSKLKILEYSSELEHKVIERTEELRKSEVKLRVALQKEKKMGALKSRFVSIASHEFRTPMSSILTSANLIGCYEKQDQQDKRMKHVKRIESSVRNLTVILNDFLSFEKLESGEIQITPIEIEINEYIKQVISEVDLFVKPSQKIIHHHQGENKIYADEYLLKNILINLLSNGVKFSPCGANVEIHTRQEGGKLKIEVKDFGVGIPEDQQQFLFTRFFRAKNVKNIQGTGLGLTIVKYYLDLMKGAIWFESKEGKGTTFFVEIPSAKI